MSVLVNVESRQTHTKAELKELRASGHIPGSVTGKKIPPISIAVDEKELLHLLRAHSHEIMEMDIPGHGRQSVMLKEVQRDKVRGGHLLHVDFQQISMDAPVRTTVRIEYVGEPAGGILQQMLTEIEVKALPRDLPAALQADVSGLDIGDKLVVGDIAIPDKLECLTDPTALAASVLQVRQTTEAEQEEMVAETEEEGGLKESSEVKLSDRPNAEDAAKETAGAE